MIISFSLLGNDYDTLLKYFSLSHIDLPPNIQKDLDEHAMFKKKLGLYDMDSTFLSEFYSTNAEKNIGKKIAILKATSANEQIEKELTKNNSSLTEAKRYQLNCNHYFTLATILI